MQERRKKYEENPRLAWDILEAGSASARKVAARPWARFASHGHVARYAPRRLRKDNDRVERELDEEETANCRSPYPNRPPSMGPQARHQSCTEKERKRLPLCRRVGHVYEGPLDLLLDLIRKQDIDIYDIPIAKITAQYLTYVEKLRELDVNVAAEFIYMAAVLIHIKSKMLLPRDPAAAPKHRMIRARNSSTA